MLRLVITVVFLLGVWFLFRLNRRTGEGSSSALWIPTLWLFIGTTRDPSEWLHLSSGAASGVYLEGNPIDEVVLFVLLVSGLLVLFGRARRIRALVRTNFPVLLYFLYCGASVIWSDFPDVSFKRWSRAVGDVIMLLIVLSDRDWLVAFRRTFARVGFIAISISFLFIRYYPEYGRAYSHGGEPSWTGVATGKNGLGMIVLVFGLASLCQFVQLIQQKFDRRRKGPLIAHGVITCIAAYLLLECHSATSLACSLLAAFPMLTTQLFKRARRPFWVHTMVLSTLGLAFATLFLNVDIGALQQLGRDSTLTGRTDIWHYALGLVTNPVLGTGYESFWLGHRLSYMVTALNQGINQAHNGYLEVYLNLGWIGIAFLGVIFVIAYRHVIVSVRSDMPIGNLALAYFLAAATYNFTEAAFKMMHPLWFALLFVAMLDPRQKPAKAIPGERTVPAKRAATVSTEALQACVRF